MTERIKKITSQFDIETIRTIFDHDGTYYVVLDDDTENLYNEDGSIAGKAYEPKIAKIISESEIIY